MLYLAAIRDCGIDILNGAISNSNNLTYIPKENGNSFEMNITS